MITLERYKWNDIEAQLKEEYKDRPSVLLIRDTMKRVLGFTTRTHLYWNDDLDKMTHVVYLDFFDDKKESYFILKYL